MEKLQNTITKSPNILKTGFHKQNNSNIIFFQSVEKRLNKIFQDELNSSDSITKILLFLSAYPVPSPIK